ncbi:acetyltransferase [Bacillus sp. FJAT-27264]|uniref:GNAT family N-acetyltransferase n=1 Tax=Paenibacillus sp. (strain DSM 101736 / FJAT-27264) TaxID=1850362 RepID=UPI000807DA87|nr:GNAT family N-acetyltransferase [Bacillus sp. FJAT-27264]OBZ15068.1 acetyltransferase [Bacillus sp. FJAT-27264]
MDIRKMGPHEAPPMELLLLADPSVSVIEGYIERGECYIALVELEIVGVYVLLPTRPGTAELVNIAVVEHLHGQGIGKQLVQHAIATAKAQGYKIIEIGTGNSSLHQLGLYQKCGFRIIGVDRDYFIRHYPEVIFENGLQCIDMIRLAQDLTINSVCLPPVGLNPK